jgi:hypothetical protein
MIPLLSGGAYRRPGTLFDNSVAKATYSHSRQIPFVVSQSESYSLRFDNQIGSANGRLTVLRPSDTKSQATATVATGTHAFRAVASLTGEADYNDIDDVQYVQSVDVMWLVHPDHKPYKVTRTATDTFTIAEFDSGLTGATFRDAYPYLTQNATATTLSINTATVGTGRILTASTGIFTASHVGVVYKWYNGTTYGCCKVTGYTNATTVTVEVIVAFSAAATASATWWEGAWSDLRGWPRTVSLFQQRLIYGGNTYLRDSLWASETNDYGQMSVDSIADPNGDPTGDQPFTMTLASNQFNLIQWQSADKTLIVGTMGAEYILEYKDPTVGFACGNVNATPQSHYGSAYRQAVWIGEELVFCLASGCELKALVFNESQQAYVAEPIQLLFDSYPKFTRNTYSKKIKGFTWDESRKTLWCFDSAGNFFGFTRDRRLGVATWHTHQFGGYNASELDADPVSTDYLCSGSVYSVAVLPNPTLGINDVWLTIKRKINGSFHYHIERIIGVGIADDSAYSPFLSDAGAYYVDAAIWCVNDYSTGSPENYQPYLGPSGTYTFDHLEGKTVTGTASSANGIFSLSDMTVAAGVVTLQSPYPSSYTTIEYEMSIGLAFSSYIIPVRPEAGSQIGTAQGAIKKIHECSVRFFKTLAAKVGVSASNLETLVFREGSTPMGKSPDLFTGDKLVVLESDYDRDGYLYLLQDEPLPFCVLSISSTGVLYD